MTLWNLKIKEYYSFAPIERPGGTYELICLDETSIKKFISDLDKIENSINSILCLRGDSRKTELLHNSFLNQELSRLFIIGNKAKSYYNTGKDDSFVYYEGKIKSELLTELNELITTCNNEILSKPKNHCIAGEINSTFIEALRLLEVQGLEHWRLFFISLLHNNGKGKKYVKFKDYSPFLSLTYGKYKHSCARHFALNRIKHNKGFIYIVAVNKDSRNFITTETLILELSNYGVKWYNDIHKELMLLNGFFSHHLLGIIEVKMTSTPRIIVNPWLYKEYQNDRLYDIENGIPVNQEYFSDWLRYDNIKRYFYNNYLGDQYISETDQQYLTVKINKFNL